MRLVNLLLLFVVVCFANAQGIVIDHTCSDLSGIPSVWITAVQNTVQSHYAHTSHGGQLTYGVEFIEDSNYVYDCEVGYLTLPTDPGAYCVFDGQENGDYVGPEDYWQTAAGLNLTRAVLNNNPVIDTSMWCWCGQCSYYSEAEMQEYLDAMTLLEGEYPDVTFIYFTGNAQEEDAGGYNRYQRNNQIRDYCAVNNKVLFDFADLDCWWFNPATSQWEQNTYEYSGTDVPSEHPQYNGDEFGHTTVESCINKGSAWWWMMSVLAGWGTSGVPQVGFDSFDDYTVLLASPVSDPFELLVDTRVQCDLVMDVYDITGRHTDQISSGSFFAGRHSFLVEGLNPGVYFITVNDRSSISRYRTVVLN